MGKILRRVMMVGGTITPPNVPMDWTWRQMAAEVFWNALKDAGIPVKDVDLVACNYNDRAIVVYERLGFQREGIYREALHRDGVRYDMYLYGLLRREWEAQQPST